LSRSEGALDERLRSIEERFEHLSAELADPDVLSDRERYETTTRAFAELEPVVETIRRRRKLLAELSSAEETLAEFSGDAEMVELAREEIASAKEGLKACDEDLDLHLRPKDPNDDKNVIIEIRAGTGGDEATLFASELLRAYTRYIEDRKWKARILSTSESSVGGIKEAVVDVEGKGAWSRFKHESGVHRVQRVPQTETQGRVHTSAASVAVLPEVEAVEVEFEDGDLRIDTYRASGAGGQHVNKTESAIRITHLPTGTVVQCQDQSSQHKNKASAMKVLRARVFDLMQGEQLDAIAADRKAMVGSGDRSEKIRTYNFPQGRVTDHRVPITVHRITEFMDGDMDAIIDPVIAYFQAERLKEV
jgi:peptide chain release factor 1